MSRTEYFLNTSQSAVNDNLEGLVLFSPHIQLIPDLRISVRKDLEKVKQSNHVTLLCGGGSGHEPSHGGYVGKGFLTAAVSGDIFASPPVRNILAALHKICSPAGTIVIVTNYTGDRLNFGLAIQQYKADHPDAKIEMVLTEDDIATMDNAQGGRGTCGTILFNKLLGAFAEEGHSFEETLEFADRIRTGIFTLGVSLDHCSIPGQKVEKNGKKAKAKASYEIGLGIHNERGVEERELVPAASVVTDACDRLVERFKPVQSDKTIVVLNNLGGLSVLEMNILSKEVLTYLQRKQVHVKHFVLGPLMTSLNMPGFSITIMKTDEEISRCLTAESICTAWPEVFSLNHEPTAEKPAMKDLVEKTSATPSAPEKFGDMQRAVLAACRSIREAEDLLNKLDAVAGDADCGSTLKHLCEEIEKASLDFGNPKRLFQQLSHVAGNTCGSSGALYGVLFGGISEGLSSSNEASVWSTALEHGLEFFTRHSRAKAGQKSMLDPLIALNEEIRPLRHQDTNAKDVLHNAVEAVKKAAEETRKMTSGVGRASYTADRKDAESSPDAGAVAVSLWVVAAGDEIKRSLGE